MRGAARRSGGRRAPGLPDLAASSIDPRDTLSLYRCANFSGSIAQIHNIDIEQQVALVILK